MNSGIWVRNVASLQNDATRTNIKDRIAIEPVPSSPPRKRALEEIQVGATILHEGTGDMAHGSSLDPSRGLTGCDSIPVRRMCRSFKF